LAYEKEYQPPESKVLAGVASLISPASAATSTLMSAEEVANSIMHQVERERYMVLPGFEMKLLYWGSRLLGSGIYPILDWMIARAQRDQQRGG
jgi:hypothetical protein